MDYIAHGTLQARILECAAFLQEIFPTQGSNPGLPHYRQNLYQLNHQGSPRILEWVTHPFSSGSSQPKNWTGVCCIAGGFFTNWAIREGQICKAFAALKVPLTAKCGKDLHFRCCKMSHSVYYLPGNEGVSRISLCSSAIKPMLSWHLLTFSAYLC